MRGKHAEHWKNKAPVNPQQQRTKKKQEYPQRREEPRRIFNPTKCPSQGIYTLKFNHSTTTSRKQACMWTSGKLSYPYAFHNQCSHPVAASTQNQLMLQQGSHLAMGKQVTAGLSTSITHQTNILRKRFVWSP